MQGSDFILMLPDEFLQEFALFHAVTMNDFLQLSQDAYNLKLCRILSSDKPL